MKYIILGFSILMIMFYSWYLAEMSFAQHHRYWWKYHVAFHILAVMTQLLTIRALENGAGNLGFPPLG
jgi:hypothetical protein